MTWTYSSNPSASDLDEVRFLVGDTDTTSQLVTNEEITYAVAEEGDNLSAAARVAKAIAAKFARKVDRTVGDLRISYSQRQKHYMDLAAELKARSDIGAAAPYAGGLSIAEKESVRENTDRVRPSFTKGMHDNGLYQQEDEDLNNLS